MKPQKLIIGLMMAIALGFTGCKQENPPKEQSAKTVSKKKNEIKEGIEVAKAVSKAGDYTETLKYHRERLQKLQPVDVETLKTWYPESLGNFKIDNITEGRSGFKNTSVANAIYTNGKGGSDIQRLKIELLDGAGEQGSMVSSNTLAASLIKRDASTPQYINKWNERNGIEILETQNLDTDNSTMTFVINERFHFLVRSENIDLEETWSLINNLPFEKLPKS